MNWGRIILGGLAAGLVINISEAILNVPVLGDDWAQIMTAMGKSGEFSGGQIAMFNVIGFVTGIMLVWLYAAIRPRFGAGPKTALCAASVTWTLNYLLPSVMFLVMGLFPSGIITFALVWGLVEMLIAGYVGGWVYKEAAPAARAQAA
jgi:hypothetical protein